VKGKKAGNVLRITSHEERWRKSVAVERQEGYKFCVWFCILIYPEPKANAPYNTVICDLSDSTIFFYIFSRKTRISGKKEYGE
jgi:hypothetical protein